MKVDTQKLREFAGKLNLSLVDIATILLGAADHIDAQEAEIAQARQTADYWKAEHNAGNAEIARLRLVAKAADDALTNYERMGEVCPFEGQPMIYAETLVEIGETARAALSG